MSGVDNSQKRAVTADGLRVPTQRDGRAESAAAPGVPRRVARAVGRRARGSILVLACLLFVASSAAALVALPAADVAGKGVTVDAQDRVVSVDPGSAAWNVGVRPGWIRTAGEPGVTLYSLGGDLRPVTNEPDGSEPALIFALLTLALGGLLIAARQRRAGATAAIAAAVLASLVWSTRLGVLGGAIAVVPVALAAAFARQTFETLALGPARSRGVSLRAAAGPAALVGASGVSLLAGTLAAHLVVGIAVAAGVYVAAAWVLVVRWRVAAAAGPANRSRLAVARTVAVDMLPLSDRVRRRAAEAERDRLASDLHAEVLPAIASTARDLEQRGATHEAEQLRNLAASVRDLVSDRRLPILEDRGLLAAAEWLAESLESRASLTIEIDLGGYDGSRQPQRVERAAYRILQLALDNVIRHAGATSASVSIAGDSRSLDLAVADDGTGIGGHDESRALGAGRLGLVDMRAEADSVGATLDVGPTPEHGTVVRMRWRG
jgi:signal transduction histidine kinase